MMNLSLPRQAGRQVDINYCRWTSRPGKWHSQRRAPAWVANFLAQRFDAAYGDRKGELF
jgi:hypothetical protein